MSASLLHGLTPAALELFSALIAESQFDDAASLLVKHLNDPLPTAFHATLDEMLHCFPADLFDVKPDLLYLQGLRLAQGEPELATTKLLRAILLYRSQDELNRTASCYFALIRIYQQSEDFRTAYLYVQEAEALLSHLTEPAIKAQLYLRLAELCPDLGRLGESIGYAERALAGFRLSEDRYNQFKAHILLSIQQRQSGNYHEAESQLELARRLQQAAQLGEEAHLRVLNSAAHLAWYQGDLKRALHHAEALATHHEKDGFPKSKIYSALLLANLYRAQAAYATALRWYREARRLVDNAGLRLFAPWIDVNEGWLHVLTGDYSSARRLIHQALSTPDRGQMMSFNIHLALLNLVEGNISAAENLLTTTQPFYRQSRSNLAIAVIDLYWADVLNSKGEHASALAHLRSGLDWFATHQIWSFPYWWHPQLVAKVATLALKEDIQSHVVEHMLVRHVGAIAQPLLTALLDDPSPAVVQRARVVLSLLEDATEDWLDWVSNVTDVPVRNALERLFRQHKLRRDNLRAIRQTFSTAQQRGIANPVLIAVFGLYVHGATLKEIAAELERASSSIRNYITVLYQIFDLSKEQYSSLQARRQQLFKVAREQGLI